MGRGRQEDRGWLRWGVAAPLTALSSVAIYVLAYMGGVTLAVRFLGRSSEVDVSMGIVLLIYALVVHPLLSVAVAVVNVAGAGRRWQRRGWLLVGLLGPPPLAYLLYVGFSRGWAHPYWALLVLGSMLLGLGLPNLVAARILRRRSGGTPRAHPEGRVR